MTTKSSQTNNHICNVGKRSINGRVVWLLKKGV